MTIATSVQKEALALEYGSQATHAALHTADPGTTGTSELATARQPLTWVAGTEDGVITATASWTVPADTTLAYVGLWSALTAGTFRDKVVAGVSFVTAGTYSITLTYTQS